MKAPLWLFFSETEKAEMYREKDSKAAEVESTGTETPEGKTRPKSNLNASLWPGIDPLYVAN